MSYTWLKRFDVELGEVFPYFKILLEISNPWKINVPFYTFTVDLKVESMDFGHYLYVGEHVNNMIEPNKTLFINSYLRLIEVHANGIRERISSLTGKEQFIEVTLNASVDLLNYANTLNPIIKKFPLEKMLDWSRKIRTLRDDFIPIPSHNALISMLYHSMNIMEKQFSEKIEGQLKNLESDIKPFITLFQKGFQEFYKNMEENIKSIYKDVMPLHELITLATKVSKNFDQNWALTCLSLVLLENVIKYAQVKLGLEPKGDMKEQIKHLAYEANKLKIYIDYPKLAGDWGRRHIAVHEAYEAPISADVANESFKSVKELIEKLSPILLRPSIYVIDWSEPENPLTKNRVIVVGNKAYYMGEPYDSWVKQRGIRIERRPPTEDYHKYLESMGILCTHKQPPSIAWLEEK